MYMPPVNPRQSATEAELKIKEAERKRDSDMYLGETSQRKRLSRKVFVLMQLTIVLLIIIGAFVLYHFLH
jgi:hypothetical protein